MSSGYPGGGPDLYSTMAGRSINPTQSSFRSTQLPGIFVDQTTSQIANRGVQSLIGKRTFNDYQTQHQQQQQPQQQLQQNHFNPARSNLLLRSVKPRTYQIWSPISPSPTVDFSANNNNSVISPDFQQSLPLSHRYNLPLLQQQQQRQQQLRPYQHQLQLQQQQQQQQHVGLANTVPYANSNTVQLQVQVQNRIVQAQDSENKMLNRLQELEKQLLDDNDDDDGDAVSVITNTDSEWSETFQKLITLRPKQAVTPISPSPTSSSSSSSSVASPATSCSKQTVMEAATAVSEGKYDVASEILTRLSQASDSKGNSEQRLMEYMTLALKSRVTPVENPPPVSELFGKEHFDSTQLLYDLSPCYKLGFMAANLAILEATMDQTTTSTIANYKLHVIDFDIGQGGQYMNLLHALSARQSGKPSAVKITAVADNEERLKVVGDMLRQVAERVDVSLHFNVVASLKLSDLTRDSLGCEPDELLAVNFAFKMFRMPDESVSTENPRDELLRRVKGLAPRVVTLVEQEMNTNTAPFLARVNEACAYYGALFDSIESTVPRDNLDRVKVEEGLGRKMGNSVACEGRERVERCEVFGKWRARMSMAGFELKPMSQNVAESMRNRLSSGNRVIPGFTVKEENGGVCFGWMGRTLTVASAWR